MAPILAAAALALGAVLAPAAAPVQAASSAGVQTVAASYELPKVQKPGGMESIQDRGALCNLFGMC
ncbi:MULTISPECIES: hypothetical protein [unclassified Rathayibacter]|uniref:hypothetical protein n=1 Tax=unclassified Rathayibacter TaxID=2609250 RepID=UPI000CE8AA62|nr:MULTISPECIES: hypothetical protein [unclassified Rathayibacter]PPG78808.1 hypothetical protein C5C52_12825 [Rathayibacter sp. AY1E5]PPH31173.1 hypothetical protein C5C94_08890 [Rathayibacter sp. AY1C3]PPH51871.1 hypothetical protein C5D25_17475 [Rathayibacter sp. AY1D7]PPI33258.1 hypothetical protein C5D66_03535 [Rathayibacter sp. AY1B4]